MLRSVGFKHDVCLRYICAGSKREGKTSAGAHYAQTCLFDLTQQTKFKNRHSIHVFVVHVAFSYCCFKLLLNINGVCVVKN